MNILNIDYAMERDAKPSTPEHKFWSAMIVTAIRDICVKPNKSQTVSRDTRTAFQFLTSPRCEQIMDMIGGDYESFRDSIKRLMRKGETVDWRNARINYRHCLIEAGMLKP